MNKIKEFNKHFRFLSLHLYSSSMAKNAKKGESIVRLDIEKTFSEAREKKESGNKF